MSRSPHTVEHVVGVDGVARPTGRTFDATYCADPATWGSEFQADSVSSRTVTCTRCGLQGVAELDAAVAAADARRAMAAEDEAQAAAGRLRDLESFLSENPAGGCATADDARRLRGL